MVVIPFLIFGYLMSSIIAFERKSLWIVLTLLGFVTLSNALVAWVGYGFCWSVFPFLSFSPLADLDVPQSALQACWALPWKSPFNSGVAMVSALAMGFFAVFVPHRWFCQLAHSVRDESTRVLRLVFIPLLPLYVFGSMLRLQHEGTLSPLIQGYGQVFVLTILCAVLYIFFFYVVATQFRWTRLKSLFICMFPAGVTAFTTMCSSATIPITLNAVEKFLGQRRYADFVVPLTANNHLIGDGFSVTIASLALLHMTGHTFPSLGNYAFFVLYFCIAKFSAAAVPGGAALVMLPIVQNFWSFDPGTISVLTTILLIQDPFMTMINVMGNGGFAALTSRFFQLRIEKEVSASTLQEIGF